MEATLFDPVTEHGGNGKKQPSTIGLFFRELWQSYCTLLDEYYEKMTKLAAYEDKETPASSYISAIEKMSDHYIKKDKCQTAERIRARLAHHASKTFAPAGTALEIDTNDLYEACPIDQDNLEAFDPVPIWQYLEAKYGNGAGEEEAWKQTAQGIIDSFYMKQGEEIKRKAAYIILDLSVYIDHLDKQFYKENRLSYHSKESVHKALKHLASFARWADREKLAGHLESLGDFYWRASSQDSAIESHKQHPCGEKGEITIVTFATRFEFRIRNDVAEQLQTFLGTYGKFKE